MAKDRRVKGCPNPDCDRNQNKIHFKVTDTYCTGCASELVFVCKDCFKKLADIGPKHICCKSCEARRMDKKNDIKKAIKDVGNKVSDATGAAKTAAVNTAQKAKKVVAKRTAPK